MLLIFYYAWRPTHKLPFVIVFPLIPTFWISRNWPEHWVNKDGIYKIIDFVSESRNTVTSPLFEDLPCGRVFAWVNLRFPGECLKEEIIRHKYAPESKRQDNLRKSKIQYFNASVSNFFDPSKMYTLQIFKA